MISHDLIFNIYNESNCYKEHMYKLASDVGQQVGKCSVQMTQ